MFILLAPQHRRIFRPIPAIIQTAPWTCSAASLAHALQSYGFNTSEWAIVHLLGDNISEENGLEHGNGADLQSLLIHHFGLPAKRDWLSFNEALDIAGHGPFVIGGAAWYHWTSVIGTLGNQLLLANPAPGYKGVWATLNREQWDTLGSFAGVWV